jgi:mono/diheme cytochrome c family protein
MMRRTNKLEDRNPKTERRPKSGIRNIKSSALVLSRPAKIDVATPLVFLISIFVFLSVFAFWISDFRRRRLTALVTLVLLAATGCRRDMFQQPYSKPLASSDFFSNNHMASRPLVAHTVARGHLEADEAYYTGKVGTNLVEYFPIKVTRETLERGRERFDIYCAPCHGRTGEGNGMVVQRGYPSPPSYHIERLRQAPAGHFFDVITQGYGVMYSYAQRVEPADRWAIAAYIRVLQQSRNASLADMPEGLRASLEGTKH